MKKLFVLGLLVGSLLLSGCGSSQAKETKVDNQNTIKQEQQIEVKEDKGYFSYEVCTKVNKFVNSINKVMEGNENYGYIDVIMEANGLYSDIQSIEACEEEKPELLKKVDDVIQYATVIEDQGESLENINNFSQSILKLTNHVSKYVEDANVYADSQGYARVK